MGSSSKFIGCWKNSLLLIGLGPSSSWRLTTIPSRAYFSTVWLLLSSMTAGERLSHYLFKNGLSNRPGHSRIISHLSNSKLAMSVHHLVQLSATPCTLACQASLPMVFLGQEYCSGLPFPLPGDLPEPGIKPTFLVSSALVGSLFTNCTTKIN